MGNLSNWDLAGNNFSLINGDITISRARWGSNVSIGGDYGQGLNSDSVKWNNGREGSWFATSSVPLKGKISSPEFVATEAFITVKLSAGCLNQRPDRDLRVELLVLDDDSFPATYLESVVTDSYLGELKERIGRFPEPVRIYGHEETPFPKVRIAGKPYLVIPDLTIDTKRLPN